MALVYYLGVTLKDLQDNYKVIDDVYLSYMKLVKIYRNMVKENIKKYFIGDDKARGFLKFYKSGVSLLVSIFPIFKLIDNYKDFYKEFINSYSKKDIDGFVDNIDLRVDKRGKFYIGFDLRNFKFRRLAFYLEYGGRLLFFPRVITKVNKEFDKYINKKVIGRLE